ncbi:MAG TPA: hypothetical protein PLX84_11780 [Acidiphilium sp.]|nr:hypothetical protein [Acidiphilium sp.]
MTDIPIARRGVLAAAAGAMLTPPKLTPPKLPQHRSLAFDVYRNGSHVGVQRLRFLVDGTSLTVDNHVDLKVGLVGIPLFTYRAHIVEHWQRGAFHAATSDIDNDGTRIRLDVERTDAGVVISGNRIARHTAPRDALPLTYWNKAMLDGPMINMQTGHADRPTVTHEGWFRLPAMPSGSVTASRYQLTGPIRLAVYYDKTNTWSGLAFHHRGHITYRPILG